jgi:hypothetical protein
MKKVTKDPTLAKYYDKTKFERPVGFRVNMGCAGMKEPEPLPSLDNMSTPFSEDAEEEVVEEEEEEDYFE